VAPRVLLFAGCPNFVDFRPAVLFSKGDARNLEVLRCSILPPVVTVPLSTHPTRGGPLMFSRIVEINAKTGKGKELARALNDKVLELLRNQPGFVDLITLQANDNPDRVIGMSFWKTQEDAMNYNTQGFPRVTDLIRNVIEGTPQVRTFDIVASTAHNIAAQAA
jgi:heme-degrading monooxygenase HmoA